jgi:hypothetical protein
VEEHRDEPVTSDNTSSGYIPTNLGNFTIAIAICSLVISGVSAFFSYTPKVDAVRTRAIEDLYESFEEWNVLALENPHIAHLLAPTNRYNSVASLVERSALRLDRDALNTLVIAELIMADILIAAHEELLKDLDRARVFGDELVLEATAESLMYFEKRIMHNPRLLYLWQELAHDRSEKLHERFAKAIEPTLSAKHTIDQEGPIERARNKDRHLD